MFITSSKKYTGRFITEIVEYFYWVERGWYFTFHAICHRYIHTLCYLDFRPKMVQSDYEHNKELLDYLRRMFCKGSPAF